MKQKRISDFFAITTIREEEIERPYKYAFSGQPFQKRHSFCNDFCLQFNNIKCTNEIGDQYNGLFCNAIHLDCCVQILENQLEQKEARKTKKVIKKKKHYQEKKRREPLTKEQRKKIAQLQIDGFKNTVIACVLNITPGQVRMNKTILSKENSRSEIFIKKNEQKWIIDECNKSSNTSLFSASRLLKKFQYYFTIETIKNLSLYQFRKILHMLKIHYRAPSLKPLQYFQKKDKNPEVFRFIEQTCGYIQNECSLGHISKQNHKQWHILGSFKQSLERIGSSTFEIAAVGQNNFLCYQVIEGTGKGYIFKEFCQNLLKYAHEHYLGQKFVLIFDNATIHKSELMQNLLEKTPHIFTPPYRPDMNGIEYLFSWIKQFIVKEQPFLSTKFQCTVHKAFSKIDSSLIESWTSSIFKPMLREVQYLK